MAIPMWVVLYDRNESGDTKQYPKFHKDVSDEQLLEKLVAAVNDPKIGNSIHREEVVWWTMLRELVEVPSEFAHLPLANNGPDLAMDQSVRGGRVFNTIGHWFFFHCPVGSTEYKHVPIPEGCTITPGGGIKCSYETYEFEVSPEWQTDTRPPAWPWVLLNPRAWVALRELEKVMTRGDTKPLTILLRSGFPARGNAMQLKGELELVQRMLTEALTGDRF
jgi:hypothetical protein